MLLGDIPARHSRSSPDKVALICDGKRYTWAEFERRTTKLAQGLLQAGFRRGDKIAILLRNRIEYLDLLFACGKAGMVAVIPNTMLASEELLHILNDSDALAIVTESRFDDKLEPIRSDLAQVETIIGVEGAAGASLDLHELRERASEDPVPYRPEENDLLLLPYTSGTTGAPKGVMLTHKSCCTGAITMVIERRIRCDDTCMMAAPLFFIGPLSGSTFGYMFRGCTTVVLEFGVEQVLEAIQREGVNATSLVPSAVRRIATHADVRKYDLSSLRLLSFSGSPMPMDQLRDALDVFGPILIALLGMTETSSAGTLMPMEDTVAEAYRTGPDAPSLCSIGRAMCSVELRLLDEQGQDVAFANDRKGKEAVGEIAYRSDVLMKGYWKRPEATAEVFSEDGWFRSGDIAYFDDRGFLYVVDRKKDMIISGGINVYPREIESCLYQHPAVEDVAVIGVPNEEWGETIKAVVVRKSGASCTEEEVIAYCREHLASYKKPTSIDFIDEMPRNATGKILKRHLRERYWGDRREQVY